jgi:hypothetical protein
MFPLFVNWKINESKRHWVHKNWRIEKKREKGLLNKSRVYSPGVFFFFQFCDAIAKLVIIHKEDLAKFEWIWEFKESFWYFGYLLEPIVEIRQLCILFMKKEMWWIRATILLTKNPVYLLKSCFFFKLKKRRKFTKRENTGLYSFDILNSSLDIYIFEIALNLFSIVGLTLWNAPLENFFS